jgi:hypothetical protein
LQNENLRQQLAVSHAQLAERRSLAVASQNIHIDTPVFCFSRATLEIRVRLGYGAGMILQFLTSVNYISEKVVTDCALHDTAVFDERKV